MGRTETDRKITNEPWSSKWSLPEQTRPLFRVKGAVCPKNRRKTKKGAEKTKKELDKADAVRDYRKICKPGVQISSPFLIGADGTSLPAGRPPTQ